VPDDLLELALELQRRQEPFALATVVRCEAPTSAKPGSKALIRASGAVSGWVGGACAEPVVVREALEALQDGRPRLVGLFGEEDRHPARTGMVEYPMTCHSGGTLEIYVEPYLPKPLLVVVGHGPVVEMLATLGRAADYAVVELEEDSLAAHLASLTPTRRASIVVATHGDADADALTHVLATGAGYVSLVASRRRAESIVAALRERGVPAERLDRLKAPAGIDLGAVTPGEIAVSILAEVIRHHRNDRFEEFDGRAGGITPEQASGTPITAHARDPVCGMTVEIATARHRSDTAGSTTYFCCRGCKETFDRDPHRYA
jgi:xanthine dehydrogenase accessory factor